ncbi:hypothetical protein PV04_02867 [Phialophora macrospora]|uniref:Amidohydrolase-related domain-containing protein n=1 Tax=Phialophora macrospora TaxID=1851006 RepID=A0A0D2FQL9_9EURO|nr:hypothetical protein PV04_02867 [Phialophora macrospora]
MKNRTQLFTHATIITVDTSRTIWLDGALLVQGNRITALDKTAALLQHPATPRDAQIVDCNGQIIIPGLINTHAHLAQSLLRGLAEDLPLHSWLCDAIWPLEAHYDADDGYVAARLTIAEMLRTGTTCFLEAMLTHRSGFENVVRAVDEMGIRACLAKLVKGEETNQATGMIDARDRDISSMSLGAAVAAHQQYHGTQGGRLHVWIAAATPRGSPEEAHKAIGDASAAHGINLTMHCAEAPDDRSIYRDMYNCSAAQFCERTNLISSAAAAEEDGGPTTKTRRTVLAHMVNLDLSTDLPILARTGAAVAHNPSSNCKLGSGIAAVPDMMHAGITVGLGTDGAPCANTYDMIQEMRLAALLHRGQRRDAKAVVADDVLAMATINGAKALGLDHDVGSLEIGKMADFVVLGTGGLHCAPFDGEQILEGGLDPVTAVVFSCTGADVEKVVVDGQVLVEGGRLVACDETRIKRDAREAVRRVRTKAGVRASGGRKYC